MSVSNQETQFPYVGNGLTVTFPYNCQVQKAGDLDVYLGGAPVTSGFTINGIGSLSGGSVTFGAPPAVGVSVLIERVVELERTTDYQQNGDFLARVVNPDFDRLWMAMQQQSASIARAIRFPRSEVAPNGELPPVAARANNLLGFDELGNVVAIAPAAQSANALQAALAASSGAAMIGWKQLGTGSVSRPLSEKVRELFSFRDFGAIGDGTDETEKLQLAATRRGNTGRGQSELTLPDGDYFVQAATITPAIALNSDTHVRGQGGQVRAGLQNFYMLWSSGKTNVRVDGVKLISGSTAGNDAQAAIYANPAELPCYNMSVTFNDIVDTSWGVLYSAEVGAGSFTNTRVIGNSVRSSTPGTKADGLHMAGRYYGAAVVGNTVFGRADAGIAMNMTGTHYGYGFTVAGNSSVNNLVGVDVSGGQYGVVSGNVCYNTVDHAASNPCIRAITYSGRVPQYLLINGNVALGTHTASGEVDVKVTTAGADTHITVSNNLLRSFYTDARFVTLTDNTFPGPAAITIDNNAGEVFIGPNTFEAAFDIAGAGNPGLSGNVYVARQNWTRQYHPNFLPNYSSANPFWALSWFFDADRTPVINTPSTTTSNVPVDVPNGFVVLDRACVLDGIVGLADMSTHSGHISLCDLSNNELARVDFPVVPGAGGANIACVLTGPTVSGNVYKIRLAPGTYKLRYWADVNSITLKKADLMLWS